MKLEFIVNKYLLIWHLLYQSSVSEEVHKLKQSLWINNKKEYSSLYKEKNIILHELEDYIPDDDIVFDIVESNQDFKKIKNEVNRYRLTLLELWDKNNKLYLKELNKILKCSISNNYKVYVVDPNLNIVETDIKSKIITIGKKITPKEKDNFLTYLIYKIIRSEFSFIKTSEKEIVQAVAELVATNELYTVVTKESKYNLGKKDLKQLKQQLYPYWLMYLGIKEENMEKYMIRDNIFFIANNYEYEERLKTMDIFSFINYIIRNKKKILRIKTVTVEELEVL